MKKNRGFTLIELLVVTVVIVTLMGIVFRLAGTGSDSAARAKTVARLQKLSNALSGYYAAFGSYPPVPLQGRSRDIYTPVDGTGALGYGIQAGADESPRKPNFESDEMKNQIEAACRAQPVAAGFPFNPTVMETTLQSWKQQTGRTYQLIRENQGNFDPDSADWSKNNIFMFGLMSFLLPRYKFMLDGPENLYKLQAWLANNRVPFLMDGSRPEAWAGSGESVQKWLGVGPDNVNSDGTSKDSSPDKRAMIENLPSQAVCARWMPNFAGIVTGGIEFFGTDTDDPHARYLEGSKFHLISENGYRSGASEAPYLGGLMTVRDGWGEDFYYSSEPPYQSYQLWSSGPNKRTFPPWMDKASLSSSDLKHVNDWIADDIKVGDK